MYVRFTPVSPKELPPGHAAVGRHVGEGSLWQINEAQLDLRDPDLIRCLDEIATDASRLLTTLPRETPTTAWGGVRFVSCDIGIRDMWWTLAESGFLIHVPHQLMAPTLREEIEVIGTDQLRYFDPPDRQTWLQIIAERARRESR